jgi:hypothetical protein
MLAEQLDASERMGKPGEPGTNFSVGGLPAAHRLAGRRRLFRRASVNRRHTVPVATDPSHPASLDRHSLSELTVRDAHGDLLEVEPLDLGPGAPATIALERERGPQPDDGERGDD